jgi:ParB family chromosome partitioning protein
MKPPAAVVQSVFDFAIREINALEGRIVQAEDDADAMLWEQARQVVEQLDAGLSQRKLAKQWINARTGKPYDEHHVRFVRQTVEQSAELTPQPRFRDAYNAIANASKPHVSQNTGDYEWYSPPDVVQAARDVLGAIDLDPASCDVANTVVQASTFYTIEQNGLEQPWRGRVYMNPPYRHPEIQQFSEKFAQHAQAGDIQGIVLVNNATDTEWFRRLAAAADAFCWLLDRCRYWKPDRETSTALQGQVVIYTGPDRAAFCRRFGAIGLVLLPAGQLSESCPDLSEVATAGLTDRQPLS